MYVPVEEKKVLIEDLLYGHQVARQAQTTRLDSTSDSELGDPWSHHTSCVTSGGHTP